MKKRSNDVINLDSHSKSPSRKLARTNNLNPDSKIKYSKNVHLEDKLIVHQNSRSTGCLFKDPTVTYEEAMERANYTLIGVNSAQKEATMRLVNIVFGMQQTSKQDDLSIPIWIIDDRPRMQWVHFGGVEGREVCYDFQYKKSQKCVVFISWMSSKPIVHQQGQSRKNFQMTSSVTISEDINNYSSSPDYIFCDDMSKAIPDIEQTRVAVHGGALCLYHELRNFFAELSGHRKVDAVSLFSIIITDYCTSVILLQNAYGTSQIHHYTSKEICLSVQ